MTTTTTELRSAWNIEILAQVYAECYPKLRAYARQRVLRYCGNARHGSGESVHFRGADLTTYRIDDLRDCQILSSADVDEITDDAIAYCWGSLPDYCDGAASDSHMSAKQVQSIIVGDLGADDMELIDMAFGVIERAALRAIANYVRARMRRDRRRCNTGRTAEELAALEDGQEYRETIAHRGESADYSDSLIELLPDKYRAFAALLARGVSCGRAALALGKSRPTGFRWAGELREILGHDLGGRSEAIRYAQLHAPLDPPSTAEPPRPICPPDQRRPAARRGNPEYGPYVVQPGLRPRTFLEISEPAPTIVANPLAFSARMVCELARALNGK